MVNSSLTKNNLILDWYLEQAAWWGLQAYFFPMRAVTFGDDINFWMNLFKPQPVICKPR